MRSTRRLRLWLRLAIIAVALIEILGLEVISRDQHLASWGGLWIVLGVGLVVLLIAVRWIVTLTGIFRGR